MTLSYNGFWYFVLDFELYSEELRELKKPCYFPTFGQIVKTWGIAEGGYFILDIRDCSISSNLSHFLLELIPGRPGTTIILRN